MNSAETSKAFVLSVLTGDTLLVRYCEKTKNKYAVILLPIACAPQFSIFLNSAVDDPFALESLTFLRKHIENKRVLIGPPYPNKGIKVFTHQTLGSLPVSINSVRLLNEPNEDIDAYLIQSGFAYIREDSQSLNKSWLSHYEQLQESAIVNKLGIWGANPETIDYHNKNRFESVIISINNDFTFKLLNPNINVELAGITQKERKRSPDFNTFLGENILFHQVTVRILQRLPGAPPLVSISIKNFDLAILLLKSHFVAINEITSHFLENEAEIRQILKSNKKQFDHEFTATVTQIISSNVFLVEDCKTIVLSHIIVPKFDFSNEPNEPYGIEAFRFLRDHILYKKVSIDITIDNGSEIYGVVTIANQNLNLLMVKEGFARIAQSRIQGIPSFFDEMKIEYETAFQSKLNIHSNKSPPTKKDVGILIDIISPTEMTIYINNKLELFSLNNLTTDNYSFANIIHCTELLKSKYLFHDVSIQNDGTIIDLNSNQDIRISLLENGLVTLSNKDTADQELIGAERKGKAIHKRKQISKPLTNLDFNDPFVIRRVISPTTLIVQAQSNQLSQLHQKLVSIQLQRITKPIIGGIYIVQINGIIYRCHILNSTSYLLMDYGYTFPITIGELNACPEELMSIPPQSFCVSLFGAQKFLSEIFDKQAMKFIWNFFDQNNLYDIKLSSENGSFLIPKVKIFNIRDKASINAAMIQCGIMKVDHTIDKKIDHDLFVNEEEAKKKKIGGWSILI